MTQAGVNGKISATPNKSPQFKTFPECYILPKNDIQNLCKLGPELFIQRKGWESSIAHPANSTSEIHHDIVVSNYNKLIKKKTFTIKCVRGQMLTSAEFPRDSSEDAMDRTLSEFCPESSPELVAILAQAGSKRRFHDGAAHPSLLFSFLSLSLPSHLSSPQHAKFHFRACAKRQKWPALAHRIGLLLSQKQHLGWLHVLSACGAALRDPQVCGQSSAILQGDFISAPWSVMSVLTKDSYRVPHQEYLYLHQSCLHALACLWNLFLLLHN